MRSGKRDDDPVGLLNFRKPNVFIFQKRYILTLERNNYGFFTTEKSRFLYNLIFITQWNFPEVH